MIDWKRDQNLFSSSTINDWRCLPNSGKHSGCFKNLAHAFRYKIQFYISGHMRFTCRMQWRIQDPSPMQFLGKSSKFVCWRPPPPKGLALPPPGNPVSAPGMCPYPNRSKISLSLSEALRIHYMNLSIFIWGLKYSPQIGGTIPCTLVIAPLFFCSKILWCQHYHFWQLRIKCKNSISNNTIWHRHFGHGQWTYKLTIKRDFITK